MLGVATVTLLLAGLVATVVGQNIVGRQTRAEIARQAEAVESLLEERLADDVDSAHALAAVLSGERALASIADADPGRARSLFQIVASARRLFGSPLVDLVFVRADGTINYFTNSNPDFEHRFSPEQVLAGESQYVTIPADSVEGHLPILVHVRPVIVSGFEESPVRLAVVVARQSPFIEVSQVIRGLIVTFLITILLSALFSRLLTTRITRRLDGLADAATALALGDVSARAPVEGDDEVTGVARAFNDMAQQLEDLSVRERQFLLSVGHDLRTPLTTIAGYAEVLEDGDLDQAETDRIAGVLATETSRLRRLVEDLMLLARLEAREFTLDLEDVDVSEHVRELVD